MTPQTSLVHIVGSVDLETGKGEFLYVNPTAGTPDPAGTAAAGAAPPGAGLPQGTGFELVAEAADGTELERLRPKILLPSDQPATKAGLIDQSIPTIPGMARLALLYDGKVVATFEAGAPPGPAPAAAPQGLGMGLAPAGSSPGKRSMSLDTPVAPEPGVSYTIQVRPAGEQVWQTIAVGRGTPEVVIDRNQFPGAERARVRVLRSTGFEDSVIAEDDMDLRFDD